MSILNDAIKDAALLQEAATKIAQEKIVKALTPRIKKIVEAKLLNEESDLDLEIMESDDSDSDDDNELRKDLFGGSDMGSGGSGGGMGDDYGSSGGFSNPPEDDDDEEELEEVVFDMGDQMNEEDEINDNFIKENLKRAQNNLSKFKLNQKNKLLIKKINESSKIIKKRSQETKNLKEMKYLISSSNKLNESIQNYLSNEILNKDESVQKNLKEAFTNLTKTQIFLEKKMRNKNTNTGRKRNLRESADMYEMDNLDEMDLTLSPSNEEEADMLDDFNLDDINFDIDMGEFGEDEDMGGDEFSDDMGDDMGDDVDAGAGDDMGGEDEEFEFGDDAGDDEGPTDEEQMRESDDAGEMTREMQESIIRKAISKFKESQKRSGKPLKEAASNPYSSFGGGKAEGHFVLDLTEDELINVLADEIGRVKFGGKAAPKDSAPAPTAKKTTLGESVQRAKLLEAKNNELRKQLSEMKLFSAKLIYVNRLFEGNTVSAKQRRAIVDAMDNAKTLNEAKLLYKTIVQSLSKGTKAASQGTLTESTVRVLGSSSRSTPSAQPAKSGVELDRWAVLAGLKG